MAVATAAAPAADHRPEAEQAVVVRVVALMVAVVIVMVALAVMAAVFVAAFVAGHGAEDVVVMGATHRVLLEICLKMYRKIYI
ncbi:hypothetical protein Bpla01_23790 [Burkholderia plantarii]|nr:hypothetical protein Bpla01_23790 [Burkholderia plantarii]